MRLFPQQTLLVLAALVAPAAGAQDAAYPAKPIRIVVPFPPGGTADIQGRMLGDKLARRLNQQVVIENRAGANGNIGMELVAKAPADGYTIVISAVGPWAVNPYLYKLPYDVLTDFAPIILVATTPGVVVVHPSLPVKTIRELIAMGRQKPGELTYGSSGIGGLGHMSAALFSVMTNTKMTHVPYKGAAPALIDIVGGHLQVLFDSATPTIPYIKAGRVRALATTGATRAEALPDLPTVAEAGVPGYQNSTWSSIAAPARTPRPVIQLLNTEFAAILQMPEIKEAARLAASTVNGGTPEQLHEFLKSELAKFSKLVREAGIKAD